MKHQSTFSLAAAAALLATANAFNGPFSTRPIQSTFPLHIAANPNDNVERRSVLTSAAAAFLGAAVVTQSPEASYARLEAVNRPDLLPSEPGLNVIQIQKFLTTGQANRMDKLLASLEKDTGFRVRVLCQAYPQTPGLAVRDYWDLGKEGQKDDKYIVLVVDQFGGKGNVLNFNVGEGVKFALPNVFWTRLQAKYGTTFFVKENGLDVAIVNAIEAVVTCLRSEDQFCVNVPDEGLSLRSLGM
uniref:TPM domain-containing protein n=1 Tax=Ditylum brightwellii TaxID=49249 RepID=A0A7S1ZLN6_9STRA